MRSSFYHIHNSMNCIRKCYARNQKLYSSDESVRRLECGWIGKMMTDNDLSENINRCVFWNFLEKKNEYKTYINYVLVTVLTLIFDSWHILWISVATCWNPCLFYHIIIITSPNTSTTTNINVQQNKKRNNYVRRSYVDKNAFDFWFLRFITWIDDRCVTLHVDQPIVFVSVAHLMGEGLCGSVSTFLERRLVRREIEIEFWNCYSISFIQTHFSLLVLTSASILFFFTQKNAFDWHGQMRIYVCTRSKHDNNIDKLENVCFFLFIHCNAMSEYVRVHIKFNGASSCALSTLVIFRNVHFSTFWRMSNDDVFCRATTTILKQSKRER